MPIPPFDGITSTLPPHVGDPTVANDLSPFPCMIIELCDHFATSDERKSILRGFLDLRTELMSRGIRGFQWIGGSFVEDVETLQSRPPRDIDVVTFVTDPQAKADADAKLTEGESLIERNPVKSKYSVDHFAVTLGSKPILIVELTRYWTGLFSHTRYGTWKGMLRVDLTPGSDGDARKLVGSTP